jgi:2-methylcitrate dehydratase PrpD
VTTTQSARTGRGTDEDLLGELATWASGLRYEDIPERTRAIARSQVTAHLAGVRATLAHPLGARLVATLGAPSDPVPARAAKSLAALSIALEYDEVGHSGHPSASAVTVAAAHAIASGRDGRALLTAVVAANECALRYQASTLLGRFFRGQAATYTHLVGAVAAYMHLTGADRDTWARALRLAFAILPRPVASAFLSSDAKAFVAATPVGMALDACAAAEQGLRGPVGVLEAEDGVLVTLADVPVPDALVAGLGVRWHTDTLSFKRFPAGAYLQSPLECAERLAAEHGPFAAAEIEDVLVQGSILTALLEEKSGPHLRGADSAVPALTFSAGYGVATLLLTGAYGPADLTPEALRAPDRWAVAGRVRVEHDHDLTIRMLHATFPLGEVLRQAGPRALGVPAIRDFPGADRILATIGEPEPTFEHATMAVGGRLTLRLRDGRELVQEVISGTGMAGPDTARRHWELVCDKFLGANGPKEALGALSRLDELTAAELAGVFGQSWSDHAA